MLRNKQILYSISSLNLTAAGEAIRSKFANQLHADLPVVSLGVAAETSRVGSLLKSKQHAELLDLYLRFVRAGEKEPAGIAYNFIEESLRNRVLAVLRQAKTRLLSFQCSVLSTQLVEKCQFTGIFIHRKYNLPEESYLLRQNRIGAVVYELKKSNSYLSGKSYEKALRAYRQDEMKSVYGCDYQEWM